MERTNKMNHEGIKNTEGKLKLRSNSLRSTERKLFYPSIPVIMRLTRNMVGYASGSKCSLIFYITLLFVCLFFTISNKERVYNITSHFFFFFFFFFTINNKLSIYNVVSIFTISNKLGVYNIVSFLWCCCCF